MNYLNIRDVRVVGHGDRPQDLLIANNKIVAIGEDLERPTPETTIIRGEGRYAIPGLVNLNSGFWKALEDDTYRQTLDRNILGGYTTLVDYLSADQAANVLQRFDAMRTQPVDPKRRNGKLSTLNYSLLYDANSLQLSDLGKIRQGYAEHGLAGVFYTLTTPKAAENPRFKDYLSSIAANKQFFVVDIQKDCDARTHLAALEMVCELMYRASCPVFFTNIRFVEEFEIIRSLRDRYVQTFGQLCYNPLHLYTPGLNEITDEQFMKFLRENDWICGEITKDWMNVQTKKKDDNSEALCFQLAAAISKGNDIPIEELVEFTTARLCRFLGLSPEKGDLHVGADADICIVEKTDPKAVDLMDNVGKEHKFMLSETLRTVVMGGQVIYNDGVISEKNFVGRQAFSRLLI